MLASLVGPDFTNAHWYALAIGRCPLSLYDGVLIERKRIFWKVQPVDRRPCPDEQKYQYRPYENKEERRHGPSFNTLLVTEANPLI